MLKSAVYQYDPCDARTDSQRQESDLLSIDGARIMTNFGVLLANANPLLYVDSIFRHPVPHIVPVSKRPIIM